jgi:hypothetical protein
MITTNFIARTSAGFVSETLTEMCSEQTRAKTVIPVMAKELRSIADEQQAYREEQRRREAEVAPEVFEYYPYGKPGFDAILLLLLLMLLSLFVLLFLFFLRHERD